METELRRTFAQGAARLGVPLDAATVEAFARYLALLQRWNPKIKLTSVVEPSAVVEKHFLDSLAIVAELAGARQLVDVGSGPGFPGVPAALVRRDLAVTLVESIQKKAAFLEALKRELGLPNLEVFAGRVEALAEQGRRFDVAVSRATFAPSEWVRIGAELVARGGRLIAMVVPEEGRGVDELAPQWRQAWGAARLAPPYAPGRALLVLSQRR